MRNLKFAPKSKGPEPNISLIAHQIR
jgi:hypothetical protein